MTRRERRHKKKLLFFGIGGAVAVLLLAGAIYWFGLRPESKKSTAQQATHASNTPAQSAEATPEAAPPDETPQTYKSRALNIELTHRKDWSLKEAVGEIRVTSPETAYSSATGQAQSGVFTLIIRKDVPEAVKATINKAIASRASNVIAYTSPTDQQRQYTNVSYGGVNKDTFNFFIVTGSTVFKVGSPFQYALPLDGEYYLIAGGFGAPGSDFSFDAAATSNIDSDTVTEAIHVVESLKIN